MTTQEYYNHPAISQSKLKRLIGNSPWNFMQEETETSEMTNGKIFDCLITRPEDFDNEWFITYDTMIPSPKLQQITEQYYAECGSEKYPFEHTDTLLEIARRNEYQSNFKDKTLISNIITKCKFYYEQLREANGRKMIGINRVEFIRDIISGMKNIESFYWILKNDAIRFQVPLFGTYNGIEIKGLLDALYVDEGSKIINIVDIKSTSENTAYFITSVKKFRYDIQMSFYKELVMQNYKSLIDEGYEVHCWFLVESLTHPGQPVLYFVNDSILEVGRHGYMKPTDLLIIEQQDGEYSNVGGEMTKMKEGWEDLINKYIYYERNGYDVSMNIRQNDNVLELNW